MDVKLLISLGHCFITIETGVDENRENGTNEINICIATFIVLDNVVFSLKYLIFIVISMCKRSSLREKGDYMAKTVFMVYCFTDVMDDNLVGEITLTFSDFTQETYHGLDGTDARLITRQGLKDLAASLGYEIHPQAEAGKQYGFANEQ